LPSGLTVDRPVGWCAKVVDTLRGRAIQHSRDDDCTDWEVAVVSTRSPAVAGRFYPADPDALSEQIEWAYTHEVGPGPVP